MGNNLYHNSAGGVLENQNKVSALSSKESDLKK